MTGCRKAQKLLLRHSEGDLETRESRWLETHLEQCAGCARDLDEILEVRGVLLSVKSPAPEPSEDLHGRVMSAVRAHTSPPAQQRRSFPGLLRPSWTLATTGVAVLVVIAGYLHILPGLQVETHDQAQTTGAEVQRGRVLRQEEATPKLAKPSHSTAMQAPQPETAPMTKAASGAPHTADQRPRQKQPFIQNKPKPSPGLDKAKSAQSTPPETPSPSPTGRFRQYTDSLEEMGVPTRRDQDKPLSFADGHAAKARATVEAAPAIDAAGTLAKPGLDNLSGDSLSFHSTRDEPSAGFPLALAPAQSTGERFLGKAKDDPERSADAVEMVYSSIEERAKSLFTY
ncbi:MAG: zf-HC2 domain-containing protein [Armatimonadetes bacterium]|nr:zf-HC2 domain-containing protein [Armatimonadota bacterium]